jgi:hypothetical protein
MSVKDFRNILAALSHSSSGSISSVLKLATGDVTVPLAVSLTSSLQR